MKKYVVCLSADERAQLNDLIYKGKRSDATKALKGEEADQAWSDEALDTSIANILRTRHNCREGSRRF